MRIAYDNKILDATVDATSENPNYTADNLQNTVLAKVYRSVADTTTIKVSTAITASYFFILNHNLTSTATITLQGNDTDAWGAPSFSQSVTWHADKCYLNFDEATYNFWRVVITDDDTGADGYIEIGLLWLGTYLQMPGMKLDQQLNEKTDSSVSITYSGQAYGEERYSYRNPQFSFPYITHDERKSLLTMWENNKNILPMVVMIWANDFGMEFPLYCVLDQKNIQFKRNGDSRDPWAVKMKFREVF
jgi:hypothetical protein